MDPFSAVASAAGLVSLGITISNGIIEYCRVYRSREADLAQLARHAEHLRFVLDNVKNRTTEQQAPDAGLQKTLERCRNTSNACLQGFKQLHAKYTSTSQHGGFRVHSKELAHKLRYPFDKDNFERLRSQLQEFHTSLLGHLQLLNLDLTRDLKRIAISESARLELATKSLEAQLNSSISSIAPEIINSIQAHLMAAIINHINQNFEIQQKELRNIPERVVHTETRNTEIDNQMSLVKSDNKRFPTYTSGFGCLMFNYSGI
ncbi:hypothetical protein M434DRAFT_26381 [Hypoxylon sp. CO27-5]|nr:hypothetical protein M434DRAFT_26381 [Hypoxylon sp. CO27-5]